MKTQGIIFILYTKLFSYINCEYLLFVSNDKYEYLLNCFENKKHCECHIQSDEPELTNNLVQLSISNNPSEPEEINNSKNQDLVSSSNVRPKVEITEVQENINW